MRYADPLAQAEIDRLKAKLARVEALHHSDVPTWTPSRPWQPDDGFCAEDGYGWPCRTSQALTEESDV